MASMAEPRECLAIAARIRSQPCGECAWCEAHPEVCYGRDANRDVGDPAQPGASFWPATVEGHRVLLAELEAELASALRTIRALHRCPSCGRPLVPLPSESNGE